MISVNLSPFHSVKEHVPEVLGLCVTCVSSRRLFLYQAALSCSPPSTHSSPSQHNQPNHQYRTICIANLVTPCN